MAKTKVRPRRGALTEILSMKRMTKIDAKDASGVDRKTLTKIDRGEEVKEETLQRLAKRLSVPSSHFASATDETSSEIERKSDDPRILSLTLRKLDATRLTEMLKLRSAESHGEGAERIRWRLNVHVLDEKSVQFLEQFEEAVKEYHQHLNIAPHELNDEEADSLKLQLRGLEKGIHVTALLDGLAERNLNLLGADYLFWESDNPDLEPNLEGKIVSDFNSTRTLLLSIEPHSVQVRRVDVLQGPEPPKFAPSGSVVNVNWGMLLTEDELAEWKKTKGGTDAL